MGRGRPKGSKNKPKTEAAPATAPVVKKKPGRKPKTLAPPNEKTPEEVNVAFHMYGGISHYITTSKEEGDRVAKEFCARGGVMPVIGGNGWAIGTGQLMAIIVTPLKKRGRPAGKK